MRNFTTLFEKHTCLKETQRAIKVSFPDLIGESSNKTLDCPIKSGNDKRKYFWSKTGLIMLYTAVFILLSVTLGFSETVYTNCRESRGDTSQFLTSEGAASVLSGFGEYGKERYGVDSPYGCGTTSMTSGGFWYMGGWTEYGQVYCGLWSTADSGVTWHLVHTNGLGFEPFGLTSARSLQMSPQAVLVCKIFRERTNTWIGDIYLFCGLGTNTIPACHWKCDKKQYTADCNSCSGSTTTLQTDFDTGVSCSQTSPATDLNTTIRNYCANIPETCDGKDNNCNDQTDEGFDTGSSCSVGIGACKRDGIKVCSTDKSSTVCNATPGTPTTEVCDGIDNDCNGAIDDLSSQTCYTGPSGTEGVGECKAGTKTCTSGQWGTCQNEVTPQTEICDGKDNDCDGQTDEGLDTDADGDGHYTTDSCKTPKDDCDDNDSTIYPGAKEVCNDNKDNDCDGLSYDLKVALSGEKTEIDTATGGNVPLKGEITDNSGKSIKWTLTVLDQTFSNTNKSFTEYWNGKYSDSGPNAGRVVVAGTYEATLSANHTDDTSCSHSEKLKITVTPCENYCSSGYCKLIVDFGSSASVASGNLYHSQTLFTIPNSKILGDFTLSYNSLDGYSGPLGIGWTHTYNIILKENNDGSFTVMEGDGKRGVLYQNGSTYTPKTSSYPILTKNTDGTYTLTHKDNTIYNFNSSASGGGKITSIIDRNSNTSTFNYDTNNNLTNITDPSGRIITITYDSSNRISTVTDPNGNIHSFAYTNNTLTGISTNPPSPPFSKGGMGGFSEQNSSLETKSWSYTYDPNAFMLTKTDAMGYITTYTYDSNHRVITSTDAESKVKSITYPTDTSTTKSTTVTEKDGGIWTYKYDTSQGLLTEKTDPEGSTTTYTYDDSKNLISTTDPDGSVTSYTYDSERNMTSITDAEGNTTNYTYNTLGQVTSITDAEGKVTTYEYDEKGNLTSSTDSGGATTQYQYDSKGNVTSITNADNQTTTFAYDEQGYLSSITDSTGATTSFTYDTVGNMASQTDTSASGGGNTTSFRYDSFNQLTKIIDATGKESSYTYDSNGNRTSSTDANGNITSYEYNSKGQITKVTDAFENVTTYTYGDTGCSSCSSSPDKLTAISDANGNKTTYEYDLLGRLTKETDPEGKVITYEYDSSASGGGNLISKTTPDGVAISYSYDSLNRLIEIIFPDTSLNTSYTYDSTGKITTMTDTSGTTTYSYDGSDRLVTEEKIIDGISYITSYTYTSGGKLLSITYPSGRVISYNYNESGRIISVSETKGDVTSDVITDITYNANGSIASMTYSNSITTSKTYNSNGSLSSLVIGDLKSLSYTRDNVGNITAITDLLDSTKTKTYQYDVLYRLTQAVGTWGTIQYTYDPTGDRTVETSGDGTTNYSYSANKLVSTSGAKAYSFNYDNNGNTITENSKQYTYNQNQRLIKAVESGNTLGEYSYNANGQRVKKIVDERITYFIYDQSGNLIEEADENGQMNIDYIYLGSIPIARVDEWWEGMELPDVPTNITVTPGDTQLTVSWNPNSDTVTDTDTVGDGYKVYWGTESGNYISSVDVGDTTSYIITGLTNGTTYYVSVTAYADIKRTLYYHTDHLGTPILMTNGSGTIVWEGDLLPFGERHLVKGDVTNNLGFPGQYYDEETGLNQNINRTYHSKIGRYLESDPMGIHRGTNHLYVYVRNNPVNWVDPYGLAVTININRTTYTNNSIVGTISVTSTCTKLTFSGYTLENRNPPNSNLPVPPYTYNAFVRTDHTPNRIELFDVPGASNIQIHVGNSASDVTGCFAVGESTTTDWVGGSTNAMNSINNIIAADGSDNIVVIIRGGTGRP